MITRQEGTESWPALTRLFGGRPRIKLSRWSWSMKDLEVSIRVAASKWHDSWLKSWRNLLFSGRWQPQRRQGTVPTQNDKRHLRVEPTLWPHMVGQQRGNGGKLSQRTEFLAFLSNFGACRQRPCHWIKK